jgi:hypothetical protein
MLVEKRWFKGYLWIELDNRKGPKKDFWDKVLIKPIKIFTQGDSSIFCYNLG